MSWQIVYDDVTEFKRLITAVAKIATEADLELKEEQLTITGMDASKIALVELSLPSQRFLVYDVAEEQEQTIGIDLFKLKKVMKRGTRNDHLSLYPEDSNLVVSFFRGVIEEKKFQRHFSIPLKEEGGEGLSPDLPFTVKMEFAPPDDLGAVIDDAGVFGRSLRIETDREAKNVTFSAQSGLGSEYTSSFDLDKAENLVGYEIEEDAQTNYQLDFLKDFTKAEKVSELVRIEYASENPLMVTYLLEEGGGKLMYLLAPQV